ncbi:unnamed protein product [marine sediment metagenome]|uniref:Uncharacterized protein n=1 Tax=marine sediment metagenome TaxID=412755 RepID=X1S4A6_9ZZZZ
MAKPDKPLLSFGARGTIADTLTFQKRGRGHFVRQKPIPKDPKSEAQLAQRQIYKDAVAAWHALSAEEKEAWRGICPGLTAYQCFMRSELKYAPPPPEEYTEEQPSIISSQGLYAGAPIRAGQRLTIPNRRVTKLGFWLFKTGSPTGVITFRIRRLVGDVVLLEKDWGDAADLTTTKTYYEVVFDTPTIIDENVYILAEFSGGSLGNEVEYCFRASDVKADEYLVLYEPAFYTHKNAWDGSYRYKYYLV